MEEKDNVIEQYEKLFGKPTTIDLFDENEDYYNCLRQQIINSPNIYVNRKGLPFSNVVILPYVEYLLMEEVNKVRALGYRVFFLKHSTKSEDDFYFAAGYYQKSKKIFTILRYSRISSKDFFNENDVYLQNKRKAATLGKTIYDEGQFYLTAEITCHDPRIGACIVTGKRTEMDQWRDSKNKPPSSFYSDIDLCKLEVSQPNSSTHIDIIKKDSHKHYFYIKKGQYINAYGYFEPETQYFFIGKGSTIEQYLHGIPEASELALKRRRILDSFGARQLFCWKLIKDTKCSSATIAASYVLGCHSSFEQWLDEKGCTLDEIYPEYFRKNIESSLLEILDALKRKKNQEESHNHYFFIKRHTKTRSDCDASGFYDSYSKSFVLLKDSLLSLEATSLYNYSAEGVQRRLFIIKNCVQQHDGYRLKHDINFLSPSQAASFVLGHTSELGLEWVDYEGNTLLEFYN